MKRNKLILGTVCSCFILAGIGINIKNALDDYGIGEIKLHPCVAAQGDNTNGDNTNGDNTNGPGKDPTTGFISNFRLKFDVEMVTVQTDNDGKFILCGVTLYSTSKNSKITVVKESYICTKDGDKCDQSKQKFIIHTPEGGGDMTFPYNP